MECVCGCGRDYLDREPVNLNKDAFVVQQELAEWDGARLMNRSLGNFADTAVKDEGQLDPFIDDGAEIYQAMLGALHGELPADTLDRRALKRWTKFSRKSRRKIGLTVRREKYLTPRPEDEGRINRKHPELTHTGPDPDGRALAESSGVEAQQTDPLFCFCGCGRRIGPEIQGMNVNGYAAVGMVAQLRAARAALDEPTLRDDDVAAPLGDLCGSKIRVGEEAIKTWEELLHTGGELMAPEDAMGFMAEFGEWGDASTALVAVIEQLPTMDTAQRAQLTENLWD